VYNYSVKTFGGDLASTWVAKLEGHVEDVTHLVKYVTKHIVAKSSNDAVFAGSKEELAIAA